MDPYGMFILHRSQQQLLYRSDWERRRDEAWSRAYQVAERLRSQFGADRILAIDSLVRRGPFDDAFDIHLAVAGIPSDQFDTALVAAAQSASDYEVDLVNLGCCEAALREIILREGQPL